MNAKNQTTSKAESLPGDDSATSVAKPRRKADSIVKGSLYKWEGTDYAEFHPVKGKDEPTREMLKQVGNSTFCKNLGKKESSYTLHVNVDGESQDPVAEIYEIMLHDNGENLQIWLDQESGKLSILAQLDCSPNIERMLLQAQATMNVTIGRYRTEILNNQSNK